MPLWDESTAISPMTGIIEKRVKVIVRTSKKSRKIGQHRITKKKTESALPDQTISIDYLPSTPSAHMAQMGRLSMLIVRSKVWWRGPIPFYIDTQQFRGDEVIAAQIHFRWARIRHFRSPGI